MVQMMLKNAVRTIASGGRTKVSVKFDDFLQEQLQDSEFQEEYEDLQPEHAIIKAIIKPSIIPDPPKYTNASRNAPAKVWNPSVAPA